ncbi:hypothetical protein ABTY98_39810 [Streptomyces sp. NPDC096040]
MRLRGIRHTIPEKTRGRALATRRHKRGYVFLGTATAAALVI